MKEYLTGWFTEWLDSMGAFHELSMAYMPQQNGVAERYNGTVSAVGRTLLIVSSLPTSFWPYAWVYAAYFINRMTSNGSETPYQLFHGVRPDVFFPTGSDPMCSSTGSDPMFSGVGVMPHLLIVNRVGSWRRGVFGCVCGNFSRE